ncbi:MAG TPA: hypothetical protein VFA12_00285 [Stellaceae bacterium]|nr:hypothetical protein [Stellaceae bacterium]
MAGLGLSRSMRFTWALACEAFSAESAEPGFTGVAIDASAAGIEFVGFDEPARWSPPLAAVVSVGIAATAVPFVSSFGPVNAAPMQVAMATPSTATAHASSRVAQITVWRGRGPETMQIFSDGGKLHGFMPRTGESGDISKMLPNGARIQGAPGTAFAGNGVFLHNAGGGGHFQKTGPINLFENSHAGARAFAQANVNVRASASAKAEVVEKVRIRLRGVRSEAERLNIISAAAVSTGFSFGDVYYASASMPVAEAAPPSPPAPPAPQWRPAPPPVAHYYPHHRYRPHYAHHYRHHYRVHYAAAAPCCCCCCCVPVHGAH